MSCFDRGVEKATLPLALRNHHPRRCQHKCHLRQNPLGSAGRPSRVTILRIRSHLLCIPLFSSSSIYVLSTSHTPPTSLTIRELRWHSARSSDFTANSRPIQPLSAEHRRCIPRAPPLRSTQSTLPHCSFFFRPRWSLSWSGIFSSIHCRIYTLMKGSLSLPEARSSEEGRDFWRNTGCHTQQSRL